MDFNTSVARVKTVRSCLLLFGIVCAILSAILTHRLPVSKLYGAVCSCLVLVVDVAPLVFNTPVARVKAAWSGLVLFGFVCAAPRWILTHRLPVLKLSGPVCSCCGSGCRFSVDLCWPYVNTLSARGDQ